MPRRSALSPSLLVASAAVLVLGACSTRSPSSAAPDAGSTPDAGLTPDAAADGDAASDATVEAPPARRYRTVIMLERWARIDPPAEHTIAAVLSFNTDEVQPHLIDVGADCRYHDVASWAPGGPRPPDYGAVHLTAPKLHDVSVTETTAYEPANGVLGWDSGDLLKVATTGGEVPAFDLQDTVPVQAILTSHDLTKLKAGELAIARSAPFALTWTPVSTEVFALFLQFDDASNPRRGVWCFFPGEAGSASVPVEALGHLLESGYVTTTNFYFSGASRARATAGRVDVEMVTWKGESVRVVVH